MEFRIYLNDGSYLTMKITIAWSGKCPFGEMPGLGNVRRGTVRSGNCPLGEMSIRGNVRSGNCPVGEMSVRGNCCSGECLSGNCPSGKYPSGKCPVIVRGL